MKALATVACLISVVASFHPRGPFLPGYPFSRSEWPFSPTQWTTAWAVGRPNFFYNQRELNGTPPGPTTTVPPHQPGLIQLFCVADCRLAPVLSWNAFPDTPIPGRPFSFRTLPDWCSRNCPGPMAVLRPPPESVPVPQQGRRNAGESDKCHDGRSSQPEDEDDEIGCEEMARVVTEFFRQLTRIITHAGFQWLVDEKSHQGDGKAAE